MIEIKELTKRYGKKQVIKDISLVLKPCTYGLVGPNVPRYILKV